MRRCGRIDAAPMSDVNISRRSQNAYGWFRGRHRPATLWLLASNCPWLKPASGPIECLACACTELGVVHHRRGDRRIESSGASDDEEAGTASADRAPSRRQPASIARTEAGAEGRSLDHSPLKTRAAVASTETLDRLGYPATSRVVRCRVRPNLGVHGTWPGVKPSLIATLADGVVPNT
jgi:hypothetical protein